MILIYLHLDSTVRLTVMVDTFVSWKDNLQAFHTDAFLLFCSKFQFKAFFYLSVYIRQTVSLDITELLLKTHEIECCSSINDKKRVHILKCLTCFTDYWFCVESHKDKGLLQVSHKLEMFLKIHDNEVKVW